MATLAWEQPPDERALMNDLEALRAKLAAWRDDENPEIKQLGEAIDVLRKELGRQRKDREWIGEPKDEKPTKE
jgi:capsule polysaccharide export protein KpsE/RkpR